MADDQRINALKGTWDYIDGENLDEYLKEIGIPLVGRMMAKGVKPRLIISEDQGKWILKTESKFKDHSIEFQPGVEFEEKAADGRLLKNLVRFEDGKWIQKMQDQNGKESMATRWVDDKDQQHIVLQCGKVRAVRLYKRASK